MTQQRELQFVEAYKRMTPVLTRLFSQAVNKTGGDRAKTVDDLVQMTAVRALTSWRLEKYRTYNVDALISLKAHHVLHAYRRSIQKQVQSLSEAAEFASTLPNGHRFLQLREVHLYLYKHADPLTWQICVLILEGWSYEEIGKVIGRTEGAIKMRLLRLRQTLKKQDLRPD
jgi:DNA-directed RNA polymerase specialized sigma24 family protein